MSAAHTRSPQPDGESEQNSNNQPESCRHVRYRPRAALDLESAILYVGETCAAPKAAKQLYTSITEALDSLSALPTLGKLFQDDNLAQDSYRSWLVGNYRIFYTYDDEWLTVWRIVHTRQDIGDSALEDILGIS